MRPNVVAALGRRMPLVVGWLILAAGAAVQVSDPPFRTVLRDIAFDTYQRWLPRTDPPAPVRIVDIDDESLAREGQWPWPRAKVAVLLNRLRDAGAASVAFDVMFAEPDRTAPERVLRDWNAPPEVAALVRHIPDPDGVFAESIAGGGAVTGFALTQDGRAVHPPAVKPRFVIGGDDPRPFLPPFTGAVVPLTPFEAAASGNGAINPALDHDGVVRRVPLIVRFRNQILPGLAAEALRVALGAPNLVVNSSGAPGEYRAGFKTGVNGVRIGPYAVQTDPSGAVWLHFSRSDAKQSPGAQRRVPAWKILAGDEASLAAVDGAITFVGTSATGLQDLRFNPRGEVIPGVEMHAQLVEQILHGTYLTRPDWANPAELTFLIVAGGALVLLLGRVGALWSALIGLVAVAGAGAISWYAFVSARLLIEPLYPSLIAAAIFLACTLLQRLQAEREQAWIRRAFSSYVSPNLVEHLLKDRGMLRLGGERRECSFVMTDLAGFTSLVERSNPEDVVGLLNEYLEGMVNIAFRHDGTLDRIVGDAVAVMFSAPVTQPDHAARAIACALEMDAFALRFSAEKRTAGMPLGITRIGVHSGLVIVGNVGGSAIFDYRPLGDAINTAARLETVNKQLGTRVCVSEDTASRCPGFIGRPVGTLVLKGKSEGVMAYEPLPAGAAAPPAFYVDAYAALERGDVAGARAGFAALAATDPLAAFHLRRLERGETGTRIVLESK